ncbi:ABC transporter ATP-binding protein [Phytohabitans kaempferiae]|uniref:ABC transporter ATP-binding protein n=1 Tax=Phytohabitans kaempferiae TaxID=1620943 RepID=A0ABV6M6J9_9ACTN
MTGSILAELADVVVRFGDSRAGREVTALDGVSLAVHAGESIGIVGESGSGKSTLARVLLGIQHPTSGTCQIAPSDPPRPRSRRIAAVFQDPKNSLNPRLSIGSIVRDPLVVHRIGDRGTRRAKVDELLATVGLPAETRRRRPRQLSGGQLQRVAIARALALDPELIVADEPTSALDVSVQGQVINALREIRQARGLGLVMISHDIRVVRALCDRIAVMYQGAIVEDGPAQRVLAKPDHPYTARLLAAVPSIDAQALVR